MAAVDPIALAQALIRCPSVTPEDAGAIEVVAKARWSNSGSLVIACGSKPLAPRRSKTCTRGSGPARRTSASPVTPMLCRQATRNYGAYDPFAAEMRDGVLYGRGAVDMKSAIAALWRLPGALWRKERFRAP